MTTQAFACQSITTMNATKDSFPEFLGEGHLRKSGLVALSQVNAEI